MDTLDFKYYEPAKLDVEYDYNLESATELNLETSTQSTSEDLDQELEELLLLMGGTDIPPGQVIDDEFVDPVVEKVEWLNSNDLVDPKEFNYEVPNPCRGRFDYPVSRNNNRGTSDLTTTYKTTDRYNYQANSTSYNYSPSDQSNCNYQASHSSSKFDYQSDQDNSSKFSNAPTANNDRFDYKVPSKDFNYQSNRSNQFDYKPTESKRFTRPVPTNPDVQQNNSRSSSHGGGVLEVEIDQNTRVRLEVGASAEVGNDSARAAAYAKATIYRRG